jgi:hypothetical protein
MSKNLLRIDTLLDRQIKLPTHKSIFFRAIIAFASVFVFLSALQPKQLVLNKSELNGAIIYANLAFTTAFVHIIIWFSVIALYKNENEKRWTGFKSLVLKCFIAFTILCSLYVNARVLGLDVDLAFFIMWGLIMSPSFAVALILYEISQSHDNTSATINNTPTFQLLTTDDFLFAITCKKAQSLKLSDSRFSNGIFLFFENIALPQRHDITLTNFLETNNQFSNLVRSHDSYIINIYKINRIDTEQTKAIISDYQIPLSKSGGDGIVSFDTIFKKIEPFLQKK